MITISMVKKGLTRELNQSGFVINESTERTYVLSGEQLELRILRLICIANDVFS